MKLAVVGADGKETGAKNVLTAWENRRLEPALLQQAAVTYAANLRIPWAHTKGRGDVRGGGRKPWRQKGTGRSRHGSIRSPLWKGGGSSFGPRKGRSYTKRFPANMRRVAFALSLVSKVRDNECRIVEQLPASAKTKELSRFLLGLGLRGSILVSPAPGERQALQRAGRNLARVTVKSPSQLTAADVLAARHLLVTPHSWEIIERRLRSPAQRSRE